ncbi:UDP-N-acetylmuramate dehydrogenase [Bacteroidota bacterium]
MHQVPNPSLEHINTFGVKAHAEELITIQEPHEIHEVTAQFKKRSTPFLILGGGSNILFTKNFKGVIILNRLTGKQILKEDEKHIWINGMSGEIWHDFVMYTIDMGWQGLENLSLIPGSLGAAPVQNIGAYGVELKDVFESLKVVDIQTGKEKLFNKAECMFGYRNSYFKSIDKKNLFITEVCLRLNKNPEFNISYAPLLKLKSLQDINKLTSRLISNEVITIRKKRLPDPKILGNAGSFFKNPIIPIKQYIELKKEHPGIPGHKISSYQYKISAGWLIEHCGWKGRRFEDAGIYDHQALILVNYGNASGQDIWKLSLNIQKDINNKFGIQLEPEVRIL